MQYLILHLVCAMFAVLLVGLSDAAENVGYREKLEGLKLGLVFGLVFGPLALLFTGLLLIMFRR